MNDYDDNLQQQFGDELAGLKDLGRQIRSQRYPGIAWHKPASAPKRRWRVLAWSGAAGAVAAAALVAMFLLTNPPANIVTPPTVTASDSREDDLMVMEMLVRNVPDAQENAADDSWLWSDTEDSTPTTQTIPS